MKSPDNLSVVRGREKILKDRPLQYTKRQPPIKKVIEGLPNDAFLRKDGYVCAYFNADDDVAGKFLLSRLIIIGRLQMIFSVSLVTSKPVVASKHSLFLFYVFLFLLKGM